MMTGLSIVLGASLTLFLVSLAYAVVQDWVGSHRLFKKLVAEHITQSGRQAMPRTFARAARCPARVLGSYIF